MAITLNQFLDQWLATSAKPRLRARTFHDYESLLQLYIRPVLGTRLIGTIGQMDMQGLYAQLFSRGLSARTIEYTNAVLGSAFRHEQSFMYETYMGWSVGQVGKQKRVDKLLRFHAPFHMKQTDSANSLQTT